MTARTADENRGSCGRRFPQALSRLNPAPDADHYSLMWSVTIPLAVLTPCSRSTPTHRRASVLTRFEGLPRDGPSRQRCLSAPHSHEDLDASVPQRPLAGFPIVSSDMMRPEAQGLARGAGDRSLSNPPTEETPSIPRNVRSPASAIGTPYTEKHGHLRRGVGSHRAWLRASTHQGRENSLCRRPKITRDKII